MGTRSDLPHLSALPVEQQQALTLTVWRAWLKAEPDLMLLTTAQRAALQDKVHPAYVATCAEMVEAVLAALPKEA